MHLFSVPPHDCQVSVYEEANVVAHRISIPLFGVGLVEAIADETILPSQIRRTRTATAYGAARRSWTTRYRQKRVGRFGWKAQHATLLAFAADAYLNEMGITNDLFTNGSLRQHPRGKAFVHVPRGSEDRRCSRPAHRPPRDRQLRKLSEVSCAASSRAVSSAAARGRNDLSPRLAALRATCRS